MPQETPADARLRALTPARRQLLDKLLAARAGPGHQPFERLRDGVGPPLVLVHPAGGDLFCYAALVTALPGAYPVLGLAADEALRQPEVPDLLSLAGHYLTRLAAIGTPPALLAGWSFGGMMSFEMARLLWAADRPCPVVVIDTMPGAGTQSASSTEPELVEAFARDLLRSRPPGAAPSTLPAGLLDGTPLQAMTRLARLLQAEGSSLLQVSAADLEERLRVFTNAALALERHRCAPGGPPLWLAWASHSASDMERWWQPASAGPVRGLRLPADHYSLLTSPAVDKLAEFVHDAYLREAGTAAGEERRREGAR